MKQRLMICVQMMIVLFLIIHMIFPQAFFSLYADM